MEEYIFFILLKSIEFCIKIIGHRYVFNSNSEISLLWVGRSRHQASISPLFSFFLFFKKKREQVVHKRDILHPCHQIVIVTTGTSRVQI
jgi:hypothetical protein